MLCSLFTIYAFILDYALGEPKQFHPLVGFGNLASKVEKRFNQQQSILNSRLYGVLSWLLLVIPLPALYYLIHQPSIPFWILDVVITYIALGHKSLRIHALQILKPLNDGNLNEARHYCSYMVSRKTDDLTEQEIARATTESVIENGHDAVIATLFWFAVGGAPMVIAHRLANTLDAMWGYKNERFLHFGWCAAKMDDILGWPSAKICTLLYACQGNFVSAMRNAFIQGRQYKSLNGGYVMAAGATALNIKLGGTAIYHGKTVQSVSLGCGNAITKEAIAGSLLLVRNAAIIFVIALALFHIFWILQPWH